MSNLVFGLVGVKENLNNKQKTELAWHLVQKGTLQKLYVLMWPNIGVGEKDDLTRMYAENISTIPEMKIFLTFSPLCDTSEELISPYWPDGDIDQDTMSGLQKIENWVGLLMNIEDIMYVRLFFTEGYDIPSNFKKIQIKDEELSLTMLKEIEKYMGLPSIELIIGK